MIPVYQFLKTWERLLEWATWKALDEHTAMGGPAAKKIARLIAGKIVEERGDQFKRWLQGLTSTPPTA